MPNKKKSRRKDSQNGTKKKYHEQGHVEEHKQAGQDELTSKGVGSSCEGLPPRSSMPGINYHISHGWGARPIPVDSVQFYVGHIVNDVIRQKTLMGKCIVLSFFFSNTQT